MTQSSRTFRIFVSSTFSDLKAERNALQEKVFPRLRDLASDHGCRFQAIDLRWGVSEEAALDQQTMKICLGEIERCQKTSPRPNFIVLLGDRYGWRPLPYEIPADEFEMISPLVSEDEKSLLEQWYRRDDNAIPPTYCLQPRTGEFVDYENWEKVETILRQIFLLAIAKISLPPDAALKYTASATEQEIVAGALKVADAGEHVFCFLRDIQGLPEDAGAAVFRETDPQAAPQQADLKARLRQALAGNVHEYSARWQDDGPSLEHLDQLCEDVYTELSKVILAEVGLLETVEPLEREISAHEVFGKERARVFIGRAELLNAIDNFISGSDSQPLAIWGASGSGKSALMAKAVEQAQKSGQDVLYRFIGATPESSNGRAMLESLCKQISRRYGADEATIPSEYKDLVQEFPKRLALATADKPLILFLDALDQLSDTDNTRSLIWLPAELPPNVCLVVSTLPGECLQALESKLPAGNRLEVQPMSVEEGKNILTEWLSGVNRQLRKKQEEHLLDKFQQCGLPLYLKLAFEEARLWKSYDVLPGLSGDIPGILRDLFKRLSLESNHGEMLVSRSLGYLSAAKNGLSEDEMLDVLSLDKEMLADFQRRSPKSPKSDRLPMVVWSRLYFELEPYLTERSADGASLLGFYHRQMSEACQTAYRQPARHAGLAAYFNPQPLYLEKDDQAPNLRKLSEIVYQQAWGGLSAQVEKTLLNYTYLEAKLIGQGVQELIEDYTLIPQAGMIKRKEKTLSLLQGALRLSAHVLGKDPLQLPSQLTGRLFGFEENDLRSLLEQIYKEVKRPWLRPLRACLDAPGGALLRTLEGHSDSVHGVAVTPDGRRAISASADNTLKVWDLERGNCLRTLEGHTRGVACVAITPDGRCAISGSWDETLKVWDLEAGTCLRTLEDSWEVLGMAVTPDGRRAISASSHGVKVWGLESGDCLRTLEGCRAITVTPDGRCAVSASSDNMLKVWNLESGECLCTLEGHTGSVTGVAVTPDGRRVVSSGDETLKVWDLESGNCLRTLEGHTHWVNGVAVTPDGRRAISASVDNTLKVWDLESDNHLPMLEEHTGYVSCMAVSPDGQRAVSVSNDNTLKVWNTKSGDCLRTLEGHTDELNSVAITPDSRCIISASDDNTLKVWDIKRGVCLRTMEGHIRDVNGVALTPDGRRAVSVSWDRTLKVWDLENGDCLRTLKGRANYVSNVALTPDGRFAVAAPNDNTLEVWDLQSGASLHILEGHTDWVLGVALTPDGRRAISASRDNTIKVWDLESGVCLRTLEGCANYVAIMALTPDGQRIISASMNNTLKAWDLESGVCLCTLKGHTDELNGVILTPDGSYVVSASDDKSLKVWYSESGVCLTSFYGEGRIRCAACTSDGLTLAVGDEAGAVYFLHLENIIPARSYS